MGLLISRVERCSDPVGVNLHRSEAVAGPSHTSHTHKRKRKSNSYSSEDEEENREQRLSTIHAKKVKIRSKYAYQTLFLNGKDSDIEVRALGKTWYLHKVFLFQSGYFANMLKGSWKESHKDIIELEIDDENIDVRSLNFVLGSLYRDEDLLIKPFQVPGVLATACLLQVENLIQQCKETMKESINVKTVCVYYAAAESYGLDAAKAECFQWLLQNLMTHPSVELYKEIDTELMHLLISSSNLLVMQKEVDIYTTLKGWMFLRLNPHWNGSMKQLLVNANSWFSKHMECINNITFLEREEGITFQPVFKKLRFQHIICDLASTTVLEQDRLIPSEWLSPVYKQQWLTLLKSLQHREIGPRVINEREIEGYSMRCGKRVIKDGKRSWKWSGCKFGFPLNVIFTSHYIIFKQNSKQCDDSACLHHIRNVVFRIKLVCFASKGKIAFSKTTGYKIIAFEDDEEKIVMKLDSTVLNFPLYIFCNFLFYH
ncbi:germ cell-less protein-like 2 [Nannospalax galili]|uniref:germ cell-less protein-like 2 n=1 Tax=Nannospalax galili TaxID=1026970 RepID=UPI0004ED35D1|nr:germ cell-less protein-like 2 [Nannospalax galili]